MCASCCRTSEILNELSLYFISLKAIPPQLLLTGWVGIYAFSYLLSFSCNSMLALSCYNTRIHTTTTTANTNM
jgi:hypothetical protein